METKNQKAFLPAANRKFCDRLFNLLVKRIAKDAEKQKQQTQKEETDHV